MSNHLSGNVLLAALAPETQTRLHDALTLRQLTLAQVLHHEGAPTESVYFPVSGVISLLTFVDEGASVEAALLGAEGAAGFWVSLGIEQNQWQTIVQVEGEAWEMATGLFVELFQAEPEFRERVLQYCGAMVGLATQSIACNRFHELSARAARWLLLMHDRARRDEFRLTHELMSIMLGVYRPSVTLALRTLAAAQVIESRRGLIRIVNREALEESACECYRRATGMAPTSQ